MTALVPPSPSSDAREESVVDVVAPHDRLFLSWIGGSILSSIPSFPAMWLSIEEYNECGASIIHRKCF